MFGDRSLARRNRSILACNSTRVSGKRTIAPRDVLSCYGVVLSTGEFRLIGTLVSAGASVNNATTAAPFPITPLSKLTVQGDAAFHLLVDNEAVATSGATRGVKVAADVAYETAVGARHTVTVSSVPGSAVVAIIPVSGAANVFVYERR